MEEGDVAKNVKEERKKKIKSAIQKELQLTINKPFNQNSSTATEVQLVNITNQSHPQSPLASTVLTNGRNETIVYLLVLTLLSH